MRKLILAVAALAAMLNATNMRRIIQIPSGPYYDGVVCCDSDHDSLPEVYFLNIASACHEVWEFEGWNRFGLVFEDTAFQHPYIRVRTAIPFAAGDIDNDGLTDIVCITVEPDSIDPDKFYRDVITIESPDSLSYPSRLSWYYRYGDNGTIPCPTYYPPDLDGDGHMEIFCGTPTMGAAIWENTGNDQNELVWHS